MAKKFNLGDYLKTEDVSRINTNAEQIVLIDLDRIDPDPANFYSLDGIDELAGNIELIGLQQPLRVRPEGERFTIISGHRRRAAIMLIRDGGSEQFAQGVSWSCSVRAPTTTTWGCTPCPPGAAAATAATRWW